MSDPRHDAILQAMQDADRRWWNGTTPPGWDHPETDDRFRTLADAALAAIDATEPTDAEIEAALERWQSWVAPGFRDTMFVEPGRMRAALIAAANARKAVPR